VVLSDLDLGPLALVAGRIAVVMVLLVVVQQVVRRATPRLVALAVRADPNDAAPLTEPELDKRRTTLTQIFTRTAEVLILVLGVLTILSALGIDIAPIIAGAGVLGIAIGFGAQTLVRDVMGGVFVLVEDQYRKGDVVRIADTAGMVESISLRRTVLRDLDGIVHSVPNGLVAVASNFTHGWSRVNLDVSVSYEEDLDRVIAVMDGVGRDLAADPTWAARILEAPKVLRVDALADSGITLKVLATTVPLEQWNVAGELRRRIKAAFDSERIEIPYPHRVVITRRDPPFVWPDAVPAGAGTAEAGPERPMARSSARRV